MKTTNRRNLFIPVFALLVVMLRFGMIDTCHVKDCPIISVDGGMGTVELK